MFILKVLLILAGLIILGILGTSLLEWIGDYTPGVGHHRRGLSPRALEDKKRWELEDAKKKEEEDHQKFLREILYFNIDSASHEFKNSELAQYCLKNISDRLATAKMEYLNLKVSNSGVRLVDNSYSDPTFFCSIDFHSKGYENLEVNRVISFCLWLVAELKKKTYLQIELDTSLLSTYKHDRDAQITHTIRMGYYPPAKNYKSW